jgi:hypothetical protein
MISGTTMPPSTTALELCHCRAIRLPTAMMSHSKSPYAVLLLSLVSALHHETIQIDNASIDIDTVCAVGVRCVGAE